MAGTTFTIEPKGPFSLAAAQDFAGGFAAGIGAHGTATGLLMTFPVEGWRESAAVDVWQTPDGAMHGEVHGAADLATVRRQAARSLIMLRGCGVADAVPMVDDISRKAVASIYGLPEPLDDAAWTRVSDGWRPSRMWATVLLHMA